MRSAGSSGSSRRPFELKLRSRVMALEGRARVMGVLNITPDSFSDGGRYLDPAEAERRALRLESEGADLLDVGGESTRPGARPVSAREELRRVLPVLKRLKGRIGVPLSIDTTKYDVASAAFDHGVEILNDITALGSDRRIARLVARMGAAVVLMHMRGRPKTMQLDTRYTDVVREVRDHLRGAAHRALEAGIGTGRIVLDPGFGFGKDASQNLELLSRLEEFATLGHPLLVGVSRKSFIGHLLGEPVDRRLHGSIGAAVVAAIKGARIVRVHDVLAHRQALALVEAAGERRP
ncbi:MAG: Dihydropteroate synthase [Candidatus Omnitrophica bacterium]|nr:Dihydropteroate synthase [Candidatus Omnitrophota bacterium]